MILRCMGAAAAALVLCSGASAAALTSQHGVNVYRGPAPLEAELAGGEPVRSSAASERVVIVIREQRPARRLVRTQGLYAGHDGWSRRYAQGFWSGPADRGGRPRVSVIRIRTE